VSQEKQPSFKEIHRAIWAIVRPQLPGKIEIAFCLVLAVLLVLSFAL
jgi:hypothetical protein